MRLKRGQIVGIAIAGVLVLGGMAWFLAPKGTTNLSETLGETSEGDIETLRSGTWQGADDFHHASGTIRLLEDDNGRFLFFEDFDARSGPDVYLYLSKTADGNYGGGERVKVPMDGGAKDGQATLRGDFRVDLPAGINGLDYQSAILWCDDFAVKFGHATLT